jgi:hypothetical protein
LQLLNNVILLKLKFSSGDRVWIQNENQGQQYENEIKTQKQSFRQDNPAIAGSMEIIQTQRQLTNDTKDFMMEIKIMFFLNNIGLLYLPEDIAVNVFVSI